jgi:hypothetical protein
MREAPHHGSSSTVGTCRLARQAWEACLRAVGHAEAADLMAALGQRVGSGSRRIEIAPLAWSIHGGEVLGLAGRPVGTWKGALTWENTSCEDL